MGESTREFWGDATVLYFECNRASDYPCVKTQNDTLERVNFAIHESYLNKPDLNNAIFLC